MVNLRKRGGKSWDLKKNSRDFWTSLVPGPSGSLSPVLSPLGTIPGPFWDLQGQDSPAGNASSYLPSNFIDQIYNLGKISTYVQNKNTVIFGQTLRTTFDR